MKNLYKLIWGSLARISLSRIIAFCSLVIFSCAPAPALAQQVTQYKRAGNCYDLTVQLLDQSGVSYYVDDAIRSRSCSWNFSGDVMRQFKRWCAAVGLSCGGNPFLVESDSVWYRGIRMPKQQRDYLQTQADSVSLAQKKMLDLAQIKKDTVPPLLLKEIQIQYLQINRTSLSRLGFSWDDYVISYVPPAKISNLISASLRAYQENDTSIIFRTYYALYDSTLSLFWGTYSDQLTQSNVTSSGIVSNSYEEKDYGLTLSVNDLNFSYVHSTTTDKISGQGKLQLDTNYVHGVYNMSAYTRTSVPYLSSIPFLGRLFTYKYLDHEQVLMIMRIVVVPWLPSLDDF